jgi:N-acetylglutamate synthase-like GNAT family acetyltransferase
LVEALAAAQSILGGTDADRTEIRLRSHRPGDMGWVVQRHGELYFHEYGWDGRFEALVAKIAADFVTSFDPTRERCWIAERNGERVGCIFLVRKSERVAKLRLLLVSPEARGSGLGRRLVDECLAFARHARYREVVLWTNSVLHAARHIYEATGFQLIEQTKHRDFGPELTAEVWQKEL